MKELSPEEATQLACKLDGSKMGMLALYFYGKKL